MTLRSNHVSRFMDTVREGKDGFSFGDPWRVDADSSVCIIPIIRNSNGEPEYITAAGAGNRLVITDSGRINNAHVTNKGKKPVFLRMGEILAGSTQERVVAFSRIIPPGASEDVEVLCIHASKPINAGAAFKTHGFAPGKESFNAGSIFKEGRVSQQESWKGDRKFAQKLATARPEDLETPVPAQFAHDDLTAAHDIAGKSVEKIIKRLPAIDGQSGMALIDQAGISLVETFDLSATWKDIRDALVRKEGLSIASANLSGVFEYRPEKAHEMIRGVLLYPFDERPVFSGKGAETIVLDHEGYSGEAVVMGERVIHLVIARKEQS